MLVSAWNPKKEEERKIIVYNIKAVDKAILSIDQDRTVCASLKMIAWIVQYSLEED